MTGPLLRIGTYKGMKGLVFTQWSWTCCHLERVKKASHLSWSIGLLELGLLSAKDSVETCLCISPMYRWSPEKPLHFSPTLPEALWQSRNDDRNRTAKSRSGCPIQSSSSWIEAETAFWLQHSWLSRVFKNLLCSTHTRKRWPKNSRPVNTWLEVQIWWIHHIVVDDTKELDQTIQQYNQYRIHGVAFAVQSFWLSESPVGKNKPSHARDSATTWWPL